MKLDPSRLTAVTAPTLIVHGDRDYCFPVSMAWEIHQAIQTSYLWVVPNGTHVPLSGRDADMFTSTVLDFFTGGWTAR
jgi:pimeloyl-ACP methyl ester carboxylesterase